MTDIQAIEFNVDLLRAILWQYEQADHGSPSGKSKMVRLADNDQAYIDQAHAQYSSDWYADVFNLQEDNDFGLKVWSIILDFPITLESQYQHDDYTVGFGDYSVTGFENFENGNFSPVAEATEAVLSTGEARQVLLLRWFNLTMRPTVPNINKVVEGIFGDGGAYVLDNYDMTMTYVLVAQPGHELYEMLLSRDALPRPSTVKLDVVRAQSPGFGFSADHTK